MSAVLDRPPGLLPTIGGSIYVKPSEMNWQPTRFEKVSIKVLYEDPERGEMTCLLKLEPGAYIPFHKHPEIEQSLVLEGSVEDHDGIAIRERQVERELGQIEHFLRSRRRQDDRRLGPPQAEARRQHRTHGARHRTSADDAYRRL